MSVGDLKQIDEWGLNVLQQRLAVQVMCLGEVSVIEGRGGEC